MAPELVGVVGRSELDTTVLTGGISVAGELEETTTVDVSVDGTAGAELEFDAVTGELGVDEGTPEDGTLVVSYVHVVLFTRTGEFGVELGGVTTVVLLR